MEPCAVFWRVLGGTESEAKESRGLRPFLSSRRHHAGLEIHSQSRADGFLRQRHAHLLESVRPKHFMDGGPTRFWGVTLWMEVTVGASTREEANQHMAALKAGQSWSGEFAILCKNGEYLPAVVTLSPVFNEEGVSIGIFGISREIALFRIIQEAHWKFLTNDRGGACPLLMIWQTNHGVGIKSMQERLRPFGGHLEIESTNAGTTVRAILPAPARIEMALGESA